MSLGFFFLLLFFTQNIIMCSDFKPVASSNKSYAKTTRRVRTLTSDLVSFIVRQGRILFQRDLVRMYPSARSLRP